MGLVDAAKTVDGYFFNQQFDWIDADISLVLGGIFVLGVHRSSSDLLHSANFYAPSCHGVENSPGAFESPRPHHGCRQPSEPRQQGRSGRAGAISEPRLAGWWITVAVSARTHPLTKNSPIVAIAWSSG